MASRVGLDARSEPRCLGRLTHFHVPDRKEAHRCAAHGVSSNNVDEMRVLTVVGARPQFIKAGPVSEALRDAGIDEVLVHTGQHFDERMSSVFFEELDLPTPKVNLDVHGGNHGEQTGRMMLAVEPVMIDHRPDVVLVYGDTNSTLAGALVAAKLHIPVAHVEAGLRSHDRTMPEEINRIVTDHVSTLLLAPTQLAIANLAVEGMSGSSVVWTGDVMYDAALRAVKRNASRPVMEDQPYVLVTVHRPASTDSAVALGAIVDAVAELHAQGLAVVWPVHPRTVDKFEEYGLRGRLGDIVLREPVGFLEMAHLTAGASLVLTDSGGLQKEAYFHGRPCVTLRTTTEWTELVDLGWNRLVPPTDAAAIVAAARASLGTTGAKAAPYGDGHAARRIADAVLTMR